MNTRPDFVIEITSHAGGRMELPFGPAKALKAQQAFNSLTDGPVKEVRLYKSGVLVRRWPAPDYSAPGGAA